MIIDCNDTVRGPANPALAMMVEMPLRMPATTTIPVITTISTIARAEVTGLILAGGQGRRMGGIDKGLQHFMGIPLALHARQRLSPQVGQVAISANRNLAEYEAMGAPVWPDTSNDIWINAAGPYPGPLAGMLVGLGRCETPYLAIVPCDAPRFPFNLIERLGQGLLHHGAEIAMAATRRADGSLQAQPVFCLLQANLFERLARDHQGGARQVERWIRQQAHAIVVFEDAGPFVNINTLQELQDL